MWKKFCIFIRTIFGTKPCKNIEELIKYIRPGEVHALQHWVMQCVEYKKDKGKEDYWEEVDAVLAKDPPTSNCQEKAIIPYMVMRSWPKWNPKILCVYPEKGVGHAVCAFETPGIRKGYMDDTGVHYFDRMYWKEVAKSIGPWVHSARWKDEKGHTLGRIDLT